MSKHKKKAVKVSLNEFLADETVGSWADESAAELPPLSSFQSRATARVSDADIMANLPRSSGESRQARTIPTSPPYTAFIGNLSRDADEADLREAFADMKMERVKIVRDADMVPKGFAYIDFETGADLEKALTLTGQVVKSMPMRIDISERKDSAMNGGGMFRRGDGAGMRPYDDEKLQGAWRRDTPLPIQPRAPMRRDGSPGAGFGSRSGDDIRIERRSTPLPPAGVQGSSDMPRRGDDVRIERRTTPLPPQGVRDQPVTMPRRDDDIRIERRTTPLPPQAAKPARDPAFSRVHDDDIRIERRATPVEVPRPREREASPEVDLGAWRRRDPVSVPPPKKPVEFSRPSASAVKSGAADSSTAPVRSAPAANPFGGARPVDQQAVLKRVEEKLQTAEPVKTEVKGGHDDVKPITRGMASVAVADKKNVAPPQSKSASTGGKGAAFAVVDDPSALAGPWRRASKQPATGATTTPK